MKAQDNKTVVEKNHGNEIAAGGIGIAVAVIIGWILSQFVGVDVPEAVVSAIGAVVSWGSLKIEESMQ